MPRCAQRTRLPHQPERECGRQKVADDRKQSDDAVDSIADFCAWQDERDVEQLGQHLKPRQTLLAGEIAEGIGAGMAEIKLELLEAVAQRAWRYLAAFLINHGTAHRTSRSPGAERAARGVETRV